MDGVIVMMGGWLILGSIYISNFLLQENNLALTPLSYHSRALDCHDWVDIIFNGNVDSSPPPECLLPALSSHKIGDQTFESLLEDLDRSSVEGYR
jgi:hypothetical protein